MQRQEELKESITALLTAMYRSCQFIHDLSLECKDHIQDEDWENLASKLEQRGILLEEMKALHNQLRQSKDQWDALPVKDTRNLELKWARMAKRIQSLLGHISVLGIESKDLIEIKRKEILAKLKPLLEGKKLTQGYGLFPHQKATFVDVIDHCF